MTDARADVVSNKKVAVAFEFVFEWASSTGNGYDL